ncbi:FAD-binding protein [Rubellimicrobium rubrum]|uniref:FAD-binding protein n=1 Tax=Rubellimicrobium rubrum TaxID=2585369 RepID=A0A5C4N4S7_9RHOB|nr:FAD-binding protein [Rubellimicrobium rubrum]TNC52541.1 FAD-binding protein [Rubellimicrobium rubrum]
MTPSSEAELAEAIRAARGPLAVGGGFTRGMANEGEPLSTAGLSGIELYEPGALTLVVRAGTPVAEVERVLSEAGQRLAFEPMDLRPLLGTTGEPTIGGVIATNASGPRRVQVGAARDVLLGMRFVDGTGTAVSNGGRVMKNVTGLDLARLLAGSHGTLGVITEVALKVLPAPEATLTLTFGGHDPAKAVACMSAALGSPFEVTGAAHDAEAGVTRLRLEGFATAVAVRGERLAKLLKVWGAAETSEGHGPWAAIRDVTEFADRPGDVWRLSVRPSEMAEALHLAGGAQRLDWGGGRAWVLVPEGTDLRGRLGRFGPRAVLVRATSDTRAALGTFPPEAQAVTMLSARLRERFDPRGLFNPGLMEARAA